MCRIGLFTALLNVKVIVCVVTGATVKFISVEDGTVPVYGFDQKLVAFIVPIAVLLNVVLGVIVTVMPAIVALGLPPVDHVPVVDAKVGDATSAVARRTKALRQFQKFRCHRCRLAENAKISCRALRQISRAPKNLLIPTAIIPERRPNLECAVDRRAYQNVNIRNL